MRFEDALTEGIVATMARRKRRTLHDRMRTRIRRMRATVFLRADFRDLGSYDQVGRELRNLVDESELVRIGHGLYARARRSRLDGRIRPDGPLPELGREALRRLGVEIEESSGFKAYNEGRTTQVPTGRRIAVKSRVQRWIGYDGMCIYYERGSKCR